MAGESTDPAEILTRKVRPASTTMVRALPDGTSVVLDMQTERYVGLDAVGAEMWSALIEAPTVADAQEVLLAKFDVAPERLESDLVDFVLGLSSRGLITSDSE